MTIFFALMHTNAQLKMIISMITGGISNLLQQKLLWYSAVYLSFLMMPHLLYNANIVAYRIDDTVYGSQMCTFPGFVNIVVTPDGKVDATAQFEIENYDVEWKKALCFAYIFDSGII
jgi:hypothetical protein